MRQGEQWKLERRGTRLGPLMNGLGVTFLFLLLPQPAVLMSLSQR